MGTTKAYSKMNTSLPSGERHRSMAVVLELSSFYKLATWTAQASGFRMLAYAVHTAKAEIF